MTSTYRRHATRQDAPQTKPLEETPAASGSAPGLQDWKAAQRDGLVVEAMHWESDRKVTHLLWHHVGGHAPGAGDYPMHEVAAHAAARRLSARGGEILVTHAGGGAVITWQPAAGQRRWLELRDGTLRNQPARAKKLATAYANARKAGDCPVEAARQSVRASAVGRQKRVNGRSRALS
jgi:hypothetical protein